MAEVKVVIVDNVNDVNIEEQSVEIVLGNSGPQGAKGDPGEVTFSDLSFVFTQNVATEIWNINHGLNFIPNITVVDSGGTVVEGSYNYPDANNVILSFSAPFAGKAYLS
jgi:hypothetical protein